MNKHNKNNAFLIAIVFCMVAATSSVVADVSNNDVYWALRQTEQKVGGGGGGNKWNDVDYMQLPSTLYNNENPIELEFVVVGQFDATGEAIVYRMATPVKNNGSSVTVHHFSRELPMKLYGSYMNTKHTKKQIDALVNTDHVEVTITPQNGQLYIAATFSGAAVENKSALNKAFIEFFRNLRGFHNTLEDQINWARADYRDEVEDVTYTSFAGDVEMKINGINIKVNGAQAFQDATSDYFSDNWVISQGHWKYRTDMFFNEDKLAENSIENAIFVPLKESLSDGDKQKVIALAQAAAQKLKPSGYSSAQASLAKTDTDAVKVNFIYQLGKGVKGKTISKHYNNFLEDKEEIFNKIAAAISSVNGKIEHQERLSKFNFVTDVAEFDLDVDDSKDKDGAEGYWEFSFEDINYDVINYGDRMVLSFTDSYGDDWTAQELRENNQTFLKSLSKSDTLNADKVEVTDYYGDTHTVWVKLTFEYKNLSEKQRQKTYQKFYKIAPKLYKKLNEAQGAL